MGSRMYMFPDGRAGLALLLLRLAVAGSGLVLVNSADVPRGYVLVYCLVIALPLTGGVSTRILAAVSASVLAAVLAAAPIEMLAMHLVCSAALALIGPGAYSIDSALFGRRQIVLPNLDDLT